MNLDTVRNYCLSLPHVTEKMPFGEEVLVFNIGEKMFALTNIQDFNSVNLKCDPLESLNLRELHEEITPGYHMNKKHWNTVNLLGNLSDDFVKSMILNSYNLVYNKLPKKKQEEINNEIV